jgi:hypothetical protein
MQLATNTKKCSPRTINFEALPFLQDVVWQSFIRTIKQVQTKNIYRVHFLCRRLLHFFDVFINYAISVNNHEWLSPADGNCFLQIHFAAFLFKVHFYASVTHCLLLPNFTLNQSYRKSQILLAFTGQNNSHVKYFIKYKTYCIFLIQ